MDRCRCYRHFGQRAVLPARADLEKEQVIVLGAGALELVDSASTDPAFNFLLFISVETARGSLVHF
jgi:hypothetical protein